MACLKKLNSPSSVALDLVEIWTHVRDVPFEWFTKEMGYMLGDIIGLVVEVDVFGPSFRVRVSVKVTKPLLCVLYVEWEGVECELLLRYEELLDLCFFLR